MKLPFSRFNKSISQILDEPLKVFFIAAAMTLFLVILNGSLWRFWSLKSNQEKMVTRIMDIQEKTRRLDFEIHEAGKLTTIERQATDQFDFVREGDLIFVFSE